MNQRKHPLHILLVDDSETDRLLTEAAFETQTQPHVFTSVSSGQEALDVLSGPVRDRPDLLLLDLNMPGINGFEVLERIKQSTELKHLPVVVLTTSDGQADQQRAYFHQASAYLTKPNSMAEFERLVDRLLTFWQRAEVVALG